MTHFESQNYQSKLPIKNHQSKLPIKNNMENFAAKVNDLFFFLETRFGEVENLAFPVDLLFASRINQFRKCCKF